MKVWLETMKEKTKRKNQQFRHLGHFQEDKNMLSLPDRGKNDFVCLTQREREREKVGVYSSWGIDVKWS